MMTKQGTALILGATGGIGGEMARVLLARGWVVRALHRDAARQAAIWPDIDWVQGDAMRVQDVRAVAEGADVILHAVNPPGYRDWDRLVLPMLDASINVARATGARLLLPGTIYNFGPDAWPTLAVGSPQNPTTEKGLIRVEMERRLGRLADEGGRVLILRAGDFFGPRVGNNWFAQAMVRAGRPVSRIILPGRPGVGHQWAYLPDVAETMARLLALGDALPVFARYHFGGHWDSDGTVMRDAIRLAVGRPDLPALHLPWGLMRLAGPFMPFIRELVGMRYLWEQPLRMPNDSLIAVLGTEPHTPLDRAVRRSLQGLGCLPQDQSTLLGDRD